MASDEPEKWKIVEMQLVSEAYVISLSPTSTLTVPGVDVPDGV